MAKELVIQNSSTPPVSLAGGGYSRNNLLDSIKAIASFFVILIHFPFPGIYGEIANAIAKFAVPFFFMCSGYFSFGADKKRIIKRIRYISFLALFGLILSGIYDFFFNGIYSVLERITLKNIVMWIFFNVPVISFYHLWFLYALIYTYIVWLLLCNTRLHKYLLQISLCLLAFHLIIYGIIPYFINQEILPLSLGRSAWLVGVPFYLIGYEINARKDKVVHIKCYILILLSIFGAGIAIVEHLSAKMWSSSESNLLIGSVILAVSLFILSLNADTYCSKFLAFIGCNHSMFIYMVHPLIGDLLIKVGIFKQGVNYWLMPIAIFLLCFSISIILRYIYYKLIRKV